MVFNINFGHTIKGSGTGAVGFINESEHTRTLGSKVIKLLEDMGHTVINSTIDYASSVNKSLSDIIDITNKKHCDLFVSIHFNAFNGEASGSEVYISSEALKNKSYPFDKASEVVKNLNKIGFKSRGVKDGGKLYVIRKNYHHCMLIETCFVDSKTDTDLYLNNIDAVAIAIVEGITGEKVKDLEKCSLPEFEEARKELIKLGITDGSRPSENVTREQLFAMLYRFYKKFK